MYTCPVCGYDHMEFSPDFGEICPSCGTEFGLSDDVLTHAELRRNWLIDGAHWWSRSYWKLEAWNVAQQLLNLDYMPTREE